MFKFITGYQERDSCLAVAFLLLLIWFFTGQRILIYVTMAVLLLGMIWPAAMRPFAYLWYGLAILLGKIFSKIILGLVWLVLVLPVGFVRRLLGKDPLKLKEWHSNKNSCFVVRDYEYTADDLKNPY